LNTIAAQEGVSIEWRTLARFEPVVFDDHVVEIIERLAVERSLTVQRMPSGAGHDAQMFARVCPTGMIFVPSERGISHNPAEHTDHADLIEGTNLLLVAMTELAARDFTS
jgi:N-carbamoyl-L-amino-acid hydrolase